jgi:hypothetical protein
VQNIRLGVSVRGMKAILPRSGAAVRPRPMTVRFYFNCRHLVALPRTGGLGQEATWARPFNDPVYGRGEPHVKATLWKGPLPILLVA